MLVHVEPTARAGYFWGPDDRPAIHLTVEPPHDDPAPMTVVIRLANHRQEHFHEQWLTADAVARTAPLDRVIPLDLPRYGVFFVSVEVRIGKYHGQPFRMCWLPARAEPWADSPFGVSTHFSQRKYDDIPWMMEKIVEMGASWMRDGCYWHVVEAERGVYTEPDYIVDYARHAKAAGLQILWVLALSHPLYDERKAPASDEARQAYAAYARWCATHLRAYCRHWEIWNEPDGRGFWPPVPNPAHYAALVRATCAAVHATDTDACLLGGSASWFNFDHIRATLADGAGAACDTYCIHPYGLRGSPDAGGLRAHLAELRRMLDAYGAAGKGIWCTEFGYLTLPAPGGCSESYAAAYLVRAYVLALAEPTVERLFFYDIRDDGDDRDESEHHMGLMYVDGSAKVGFAAYNTMARLLRGQRFACVLDAGAGIACYEYAGDGGRTLVAWAMEGAAILSLAIAAPEATVTDLMGNPARLCAVGGQLNLPVTYEPIFITAYGEAAPGAPVCVAAEERNDG
jgi:hypothetical protein